MLSTRWWQHAARMMVSNCSVVWKSGSQPQLCPALQSISCLWDFIFFLTLFLYVHGSLSLSNTSAITLINTFRDGLGENKDHPDECHPVQSHRIVLLAQKQQSKNSLKSSAHAGLNSAVASFVESERRSNYMSTSPSVSPDSSPLSEESSSFFDGYTGTKPLIGEH